MSLLRRLARLEGRDEARMTLECEAAFGRFMAALGDGAAVGRDFAAWCHRVGDPWARHSRRTA